MDIFTLVCVLLILFISTCLGITLLSDADILTFLACHLGKQPAESYRHKVIWITGASSGIGEGIMKELAKCEGSKLVISARREDELKRVKIECLESNPGRSESSILVLPLDMPDYSSHKPALKTILDKFGKLDILISNAGRSQRALWHEIEPEVDKQLFELNVFSLVNMNRVVVRHFLKSGGGQLVVSSSILGKIGGHNCASYSASKHALHGYFDSLRNETRGKNIDITLLCIGPVFSGILKEAFTAKRGEKLNEDTPKDSRMTAERCAYLSCVATANKLEESWLAPFPIVLITYLATYFPFAFSMFAPLLASKLGLSQKVRDRRNVWKDDKSKSS